MLFKTFNVKKIILIILILVLFVIVYVQQVFCRNKVENFLTEKINNEKRTLFKTKSPYQKIEIMKVGEPLNLGKCLILDNEVQLCSHDEHKYHELMVHFPIRYLKKLEKVLIIGGGDLMNLREVMKYSTIQKIYVLELDKKVVKTCLKFFDVSDYNLDSRVQIMYGDAAKSILNLKSMKFDLIILDLTESLPNNVSVGKLSFLKSCKKLLDKYGVLVMNGKGNESRLSKIFKYTNSFGCYLKTFEEYYEFVLCSDKIDFSSQKLKDSKKAKWKNIKTTFYNKNNHFNYFNWYSFMNKEHI